MNKLSWNRSMGVLALAALGACGTPDGGDGAPDPRNEASLRRLQSCDDVKTRLADVLTEQMVQGYGYRGGGMLEGDLGAEAPSSNGANDGASGDAPGDFTGTNNQEAGVDEIDIVKTNGTHLFVAEDRALHVVKSWPAAEAEKLATVDLPGWTQGLFLVEDKLVVFVQLDTSPFGSTDERGWYPAQRVLILDVSDPAAPSVERTIDLDGWLVDARLIGDEVTFVTSQYMQAPQDFWNAIYAETFPYPESLDWNDPAAVEAYRADLRAFYAPRVQAAVAALDLDEVLPRWRTEAGADVEAMYACSDLYAPQALSPLSMLSVVQLDTETGELGATGLMSDGWTVYASTQSLYIAQTSAFWWGFHDAGLSHVHKFDLQAGAEPDYVASGIVSGWLYDQFAMSEYDGHLRVATTDLIDWWAPPEEEAEQPANNVFVLRDDGAGTLEQVGHVGGIAPGERIMAARMMGEKGYVVTFRQVDPLYTIDLSNPTDPKVVGELKVPGYSAYLHPVDDDTLLAVGMAGLDTGELTGLAVTMFDVSDFADPRLLHDLEVQGEGWSWSEALWDHHAFTYHRNTLTIPAFTETYDESSGTWSGFSGTISFAATRADGIEEIGRVDHRELVEQSECLWGGWSGGGDVVTELAPAAEAETPADGGTDPAEPPVDAEPYDPCGWDAYWYAQVRRSVYIEDNLFTISNYGVKVNDLEDPAVEHAAVLFFPAESEP
jgi:uncharacterized secreted protein with C-terminal beta-propeller domain